MTTERPGTTPSTIPEAEVSINTDLVRGLLSRQHPDLADRTLSVVAEGWDNATVRCGADLAVRVPRRALGAKTLEVELKWLPTIAPHLPVRTPAALRIGEPDESYPWRWAIVPWIEGDQAAATPPDAGEAAHVGEILRALHDIDVPDDPPRNVFRGGPLSDRIEVTTNRLDRLEQMAQPEGVDFGRLRQVFMAGASTVRDIPETWLHADFHPRNLIVDNGTVAGLIDWGDMCVGDPYTDLGAAWLLFDPGHHSMIWDAYGPTEATLERTRAWVVSYGTLLFEAGLSGDRYLEEAGRSALRRVLS